MAKTQVPREVFEVFLDATELGGLQRVGTVRRDGTRTDLPGSFEYDRAWLGAGRAFMLDPRLELWPGEQRPPAKAPAFGILMDSAPDRWGRVLMERREAAAARREKRRVRALQEFDFLLGVHDETRVGGLRFRAVGGGPFLDDSREHPAPPVTSLRELAHISRSLEDPEAERSDEYERWLAMLVAPGTSLGGARPKANFTDDGRLWIAKFPSREDRYDVGAWEYVVHQLAHSAGIQVPEARVEKLSDRYRTFCVARFDRTGRSRRMYASAMTLLDRRDGEEGGSYLDLAELIASQGAGGHVEEDLEQLFRRVVFNVLVGNRDDHLRNHGFIRTSTGWRLAPAFDVNPNPNRAEHTLALDGAVRTPSVDIVMETIRFYRLDLAKARRIVNKIAAAVSGWTTLAKELKLSRDEQQRMELVIQRRV